MTNTEPSLQRRRHTRLVVAAVAVLAVDLLSKVAASTYLDTRGIELPGPLDLRLGYNPGVAFGMGDNAPAWLVLTLTGGVAPARAYIDRLLPLVLNGIINPGKVFDQSISLDQVPIGYQAMADRTALKVLVRP